MSTFLNLMYFHPPFSSSPLFHVFNSMYFILHTHFILFSRYFRHILIPQFVLHFLIFRRLTSLVILVFKPTYYLYSFLHTFMNVIIYFILYIPMYFIHVSCFWFSFCPKQCLLKFWIQKLAYFGTDYLNWNLFLYSAR